MRGGGRQLDSSGLLDRFPARIDEAIRASRRSGEPVLAAVTAVSSAVADPAAAVMLGDVDGLDWAVLDQPDNRRLALAGVGCAWEIRRSGPGRFREAADEWRRLIRSGSFDEPRGSSASGPIALGGFGFTDSGSAAGPWSAFGASSLQIPSVALSRIEDEVHITLCAVVDPESDAAAEAAAAASLLDRLALGRGLAGRAPQSDGSKPLVSSVLSPAHYEAAVRHVLEAIDEGRVEKVVLAREVLVRRQHPFSPADVFAALRDMFPSCFNYAVSRGGSVLIGASPELLIRKQGLRASTIALAGSAARSADPAMDDHVGEGLVASDKDRREQGIVTERIVKALEPVSVWVNPADRLGIAKIANIQHLATPIRAQLREAVSVLDLVGLLHPTPAVGGSPWEEARRVMAEAEGMDRGWYASPVGWIDSAEDGEFCVALRGALIDGAEARCYAGVGVVEGSDAAAELAETELKLQAVLPVLSI